MKLILKIVTVLCLFSVIVGCQSQKKTQSLKKFTLNLQEGDPHSLHPHLGVDLRSRCLYLSLFEPLMRRNSNGKLEFAAAEKVDIDPTQRIYTFHIRPHIWSNGEAVTAYHFEKAWRFALDPGSYCIRADLFYPIKNAEKVKKGELPQEALGIRVPNEKTLIIELQHPTPYFLDLTASSFFCPLYEPTDKEPTQFNGPFVVGQWCHEQKLILLRNPDYWDHSAVQLQEVWFTMVKDPMTALAMYEKGELDLVGDPFSSLPFDAIPNLMESERLRTRPISRIFYLFLNTNSYPLNDKSIRKALGLSIDRHQLTQHLFFGEIPTLSPLPLSLSMVDDQEFTLEDPRFLFERGLADLGLTRETFPKIVLDYADLSGQKKLAECIREQWKEKLGIVVELVCSEWNVHSANLRRRNYQISTLHLTTLYQDPMFFFDLFRDKDTLSNYSGWENPEYRLLLAQSEEVVDEDARYEILRQAEKKLFNEMPVISIFTQNLKYLVQDHVKELVISDLGIYDFKRTRVK